jgi:hypothetical protein
MSKRNTFGCATVILLAVAFLLSLLFSSCTKFENGFEVYKIEQGEHSSNHLVRTLAHDYLMFNCTFNQSAKYTTVDPVNQGDINKLMGFADCNDSHQKNSARFGWRWFNGELQIHAYVYNDGVRSSEFIRAVGIGSNHSYKIQMTSDTYEFTVDNTTVSMPRTNDCEFGVYYMLFPYFGGDEVAPQDITILVDEQGSRGR